MSLFGLEPAPVRNRCFRENRRNRTCKSTVVDSDAGLAALADALAKASIISFDTETTSTDEMTAGLVGISLAVEAGAGLLHPGRTQGREAVADSNRCFRHCEVP